MKFLKTLFILLVVAAFAVGVYAGFMFASPVIKFKMLKSDAEDVMKFSLEDEMDLKKKLLKVMDDREIPYKKGEYMDIEDIKEVQVWIDDNNRYAAQIKYAETVDFYGIYKRTYNYKLDLGQ